MKITFKRSIAAAAAMISISGLARAEEIHIDVTGKTPKAVHAEIIDAAYKVCQSSDAAILNTASQSECVSDTINKADADYRHVRYVHVARLTQAQATALRNGEQ